MKRNLRRLAKCAVTVAILLIAQHAHALVPSDSFQITSPSSSGTSAYTIYYHVSPTARIGTSLNVTVMLVVDELTGLKLYVQDYGLTAILQFGNGHFIGNSVNVTYVSHERLYAGGRWGPLNISLPLTEQNTGLSAGQMVTANITIGLLTTVWNDVPVGMFIPDSGQRVASSVQVADPVGTGAPPVSIIQYALIFSGVGVLVVRSVAFRKKTE